MSWLANLFSPKMIADTAKSAVRGLDDIVYTEQEQAEKTQQAQDLYAKLWMAATPSALARRIIASLVVGVWCFMIIFAVLVYGFNKDWSKFTLELLKEIVLQPVNIILGFYFIKL